MPRFFGSKKQRKRNITSAEQYYREKYGEEKDDSPSDRDTAIMQKLIEIGAYNIKKSSGYLTKYSFDLPIEHEDDVTQRITLVEESDKDVHIDAELIHEFPLFLHVTVKEDTRNREFESVTGMSIINFVNIKTNNDKLATKILDDSYVSEYFFQLVKDVVIISANKSTLSAKLTSIDKLKYFFKLIARMVNIAEKR